MRGRRSWSISPWSSHSFTFVALISSKLSHLVVPAVIFVFCIYLMRPLSNPSAACASTISSFLAIKYPPTFAVSWTLFLSVCTYSWVRSWSSISTRPWQKTTPNLGRRPSQWQWTGYNKTYGLLQSSRCHILILHDSVCSCHVWSSFTLSSNFKGFAWTIVALMAHEIAWSLISHRIKVT